MKQREADGNETDRAMLAEKRLTMPEEIVQHSLLASQTRSQSIPTRTFSKHLNSSDLRK